MDGGSAQHVPQPNNKAAELLCSTELIPLALQIASKCSCKRHRLVTEQFNAHPLLSSKPSNSLYRLFLKSPLGYPCLIIRLELVSTRSKVLRRWRSQTRSISCTCWRSTFQLDGTGHPLLPPEAGTGRSPVVLSRLLVKLRRGHLIRLTRIKACSCSLCDVADPIYV